MFRTVGTNTRKGFQKGGQEAVVREWVWRLGNEDNKGETRLAT